MRKYRGLPKRRFLNFPIHRVGNPRRPTWVAPGCRPVSFHDRPRTSAALAPSRRTSYPEAPARGFHSRRMELGRRSAPRNPSTAGSAARARKEMSGSAAASQQTAIAMPRARQKTERPSRGRTEATALGKSDGPNMAAPFSRIRRFKATQRVSMRWLIAAIRPITHFS